MFAIHPKWGYCRLIPLMNHSAPPTPQWAKITHFGSSRDSCYFRVSVGIWMPIC